jgi:hypothetical protein
MLLKIPVLAVYNPALLGWGNSSMGWEARESASHANLRLSPPDSNPICATFMQAETLSLMRGVVGWSAGGSRWHSQLGHVFAMGVACCPRLDTSPAVEPTGYTVNGEPLPAPRVPAA